MPLLPQIPPDVEAVGDEPATIATSDRIDRPDITDRIELIDRIARETLGLHGV
ncbi:hypothetical protein GCM10027515_04020 [Schumannella luteola]|uniref:Uncharacterized protein n=1 Tax=Schumannella luteola TaxID=472059 RepID=A0A852Y9C3_9MICO|nr:hypothetical protein [Schumannella luteola]NYG98462.1 hypothetical protein [Schumannella luteola]